MGLWLNSRANHKAVLSIKNKEKIEYKNIKSNKVTNLFILSVVYFHIHNCNELCLLTFWSYVWPCDFLWSLGHQQTWYKQRLIKHLETGACILRILPLPCKEILTGDTAKNQHQLSAMWVRPSQIIRPGQASRWL